jgi:protein-tyrosine-phosphatase
MSADDSTPAVGVVCYANILRSQVLAAYLRVYAARFDCQYRVIDAGVCSVPSRDIPRPDVELERVEGRLRRRGLAVRLVQSTWSDDVAYQLSDCVLILAADGQVRRALASRLPSPQPALYGFYEFIGEGDRDYQDTYDYERQLQRPLDFERSFDELKRIARAATPVLAERVCNGAG